MLIKIILLLLTVFAIMAVQTEKLNRAVIYLAAFSLFASLSYLLYSAPDVAMAEAIIGSTLATIMYLIALNKHNVFSICCYGKSDNGTLNLVKKYCKSHELEPDIISEISKDNYDFSKMEHDLIIEEMDGITIIYGRSKNYHIDGLEKFIGENMNGNKEFHFRRL